MGDLDAELVGGSGQPREGSGAALGTRAGGLLGGSGQRRRRVPGGRVRRLQVRVTDAEMELLETAAGRAGVSKQRLLVESALMGDRPPPAERKAWFSTLLVVRRMLDGVATNLNQLARLGNTTGEQPAGLDAAVGEVQDAVLRVHDLMDQLEGLS